MRWIFLTLLLLNVLVAAVQWVNREAGSSHSPAPAVSQGGHSIVLLRERDLARSSVDANSSQVLAEDGASRSCLVIGPAANQQQAQALAQKLGAESLGARVLSKEIVRAPDYWVYLPPLPDRETALRVLKELQQVRKVDSFLISQGPLLNGISLGLFKNRETAVALQRERIAQGLDARLVEVERTGTGFWVVVELPSEAVATQKINQLLTTEEFSGEKRQIYCKGIASLEKVP